MEPTCQLDPQTRCPNETQDEPRLCNAECLTLSCNSLERQHSVTFDYLILSSLHVKQLMKFCLILKLQTDMDTTIIIITYMYSC